MKFALCVLSVLSPAICQAQVAGDWVGTISTPKGEHRVVLHIQGPDAALKATTDDPDQGLYNIPIEVIRFSDGTLRYSLPPFDIEYSGTLTSDGRIDGVTTQHGSSVSLVLARSADAKRVLPPVSNLKSDVDDRTYHHVATGVEFSMPDGWTFQRTTFNASNNGPVAILRDSSGKAMFIQVWMMKVHTSPENMPRMLDGVVAHELLLHKGEGPSSAGRFLPNYTIADDTVRRTIIGGHPALLAVGHFERNGKQFGELLGWIFSENTRTHFVVQAAAENLESLDTPFNGWLESAKIP